MARNAAAAVRRLHPDRAALADLGPVAAVLLAVALTLAVVTDGAVPAIWTRVLLAASLPLNVVTALWLTQNLGSE